MLYGAAQPGGSLTALGPGESTKLLNAEDVAAGTKSVAIARAPGPLQIVSPILFSMHFAEAATATVTIEGANEDVDGQYQTVYTSVNFVGAATEEFYQDAGNFAFYRVNVTAYVGGGKLTVKAQR